MGKVLIKEENLTNIANAIREKNGETTTYKPGDMASAIQEIKGSVPEKGIVINEWDSDGYPTKISVVGMTEIPERYFTGMLKNDPVFKNISHKNEIYLPDTLISIGDSAFSGCSNLYSIDIPSRVTSIGDSCFYQCSALALTELPSGITSIGKSCFYQCSKLALTELPSEITSIGESTFYICSKLALTALPSGVTSIGGRAFLGCSSITLSELPRNLNSIGLECFKNCKLITIKTIPSGVTSLDSGAFYGCTSLTEITCEGDITSLSGGYANGSFEKCSALTKFVLPNVTSVPTMDSSTYTFASTPIASGTGYIYVPDTLVEDFKAATNWSTYADQIKPISEMPTE